MVFKTTVGRIFCDGQGGFGAFLLKTVHESAEVFGVTDQVVFPDLEFVDPSALGVFGIALVEVSGLQWSNQFEVVQVQQVEL